MNALTVIPPTNVDAFRASTDAATMCKEIVIATASKIGGKSYVAVEGWQAIAIAHGCTASAIEVRRIEDDGCKGFAAIGVIRRMSDGAEIARAEGFVGDDERTWARRDVYARRAMAQTRAVSRACRSAFAHVVVMMKAGLQTTPAEEIPFEEHDRHTPPGASQRQQQAPTPFDAATETPAPKRSQSYEMMADAIHRCKTVDELHKWADDNAKALAKFDAAEANDLRREWKQREKAIEQVAVLGAG